jgi:penicillin amidase
MDRETTRRRALAALLGGGTAALGASSAGGLLDRFAPLSGRAWESGGDVPDTVEGPYGPATVTYDDHHVPHVEADSEAAAYFAVGYVQAADRLFQMDLIRRLMGGRLAAAVGEQGVESDLFHRRMDFRGAAEASWEAIQGSESATLTAAFTDGVNAFLDAGPAPLEAGLVGYDIDAWDPVDTLLVGTQIAWGLTGSFGTLRRAVLRERLDGDDYERLFGARFDHGAPILKDGIGGDLEGVGGSQATRAAPDGSDDTLRSAGAGLASALAAHEPPDLWGSNHWAVSGEHTESGAPTLAYDPHLTLMAPPVWYEQHVTVGDVNVRGATFPGIPFAIVGENDHGAWGFTNTGADVMDLYDYETRGTDGDGPSEYRYRGEYREFETEVQTVPVAGGENREVTVRKTVHGPYLEREVNGESQAVGVAWTGHSGTRESQAIYEFGRSTGRDDYREALRKMDVPTQNALYVDDDGILYKVSGRIPVRRVDGEVVPGDRVFDGSAGEGEWEGFEPFGQSSWDGFVPFEDKPGVVDPDYVGTANQRVADDPTYPVGQGYASGFRGARIYERLEARIERGDPVTREWMANLQRDHLDIRARELVPAILDAREQMPDAADPYLDALADWDYRMNRDSEAALFFDEFYDRFRAKTWEDDFSSMGLDESFWPQEWPLVTLPPDDEFFGGDRATVLAEAVADAVAELDGNDEERYGDRNRTTIDHQFGGQVPALNYPRYETDGTAFTVFNVHDGAGAGSSWRQVTPRDGESLSVIPGGQDGSYFSEHYHDQLQLWADGEYKPMRRTVPDDDPDVRVEGEE